jgi:hypothetical protein
MICTGNVWVEESTGSAAEADLVGEPCTCSWSAKDLANEMFFNFLDVKPGDIGEDTVSLHVDNNDAWVCAEITNLKNFENGCDSPENKIDTTCGTGLTDSGEGLGELQDNLFFTIWKDTDCDNVFDNSAVAGRCTISDPNNQDYCSGKFNEEDCNDATYADCEWVPAQPAEQILVENQKATSNSWPIADSTTGSGPIKGDTDYCIGIAWNVPITASNIIQSDSLTGDVIFNAVQARNMKNFRCSDLHAEVCDDKDNDYDNIPDNGPLWTNKGNACSVGVGVCATAGIMICDANNPTGGLVCSAVAGQPSEEICDTLDNDCDGVVNNGILKDWYQDSDSDGFGSDATLNACAPTSGFVENSDDCNDNNVNIHPMATEIAGDGVDQDCSGSDARSCYLDSDKDGYGSIVEVIAVDGICDKSQSESDNSIDCNDSNPATYPLALEICNGLDDNCDGQIDEGFANTDGDSTSDCVDPDDDNDSVLDGPDVADLNPQSCQDIDNDTCDDCSQNPISSASQNFAPSWPIYFSSVTDDGSDSDDDGICDVGEDS